MISDSDFVQLTSLIRERTGIFLPPGKKPLLAARLAERIRTLGLSSYADYHQHVLASGSSELSRMTDAVCTNETRFFRDTEQLDHLERVLIPAWIKAAKGKRRIRVWSAGCSTGEEPFTIAMLLLARLPADLGFSIEVLASDISGQALDRARAARWSTQRMQEIPEAYRRRFFEVDPTTGDFTPTPELRNVVRFQRFNLYDWYYPVTGRFDLIFCRNVLIYFDTETRVGVTRRLVERLSTEGLLLLGLSESLLALRDGSLSPSSPASAGVRPLHAVGPAIYAQGKRARHSGSGTIVT